MYINRLKIIHRINGKSVGRNRQNNTNLHGKLSHNEYQSEEPTHCFFFMGIS